MQKIALTGNIASGKSQVESFIRAFNIPVIDADEIVLKLYCNADFVKKMSEKFCNYDFIENNTINRKKLADIVFSDIEFKNSLEKFVHPLVFEEIEKFFAQNTQKPCVVASVPLLFECGFQNNFDKIILVTAALEIREKRLMTRNNLTSEQAKTRIISQMPQEKKINRADFVIENNGSLDELEQKVKNLMEQLNAG